MASHDYVLSDHPVIQFLLSELGVDLGIIKECTIKIPAMGPVEITLTQYSIDDMFLVMAKKQGYVPAGCLLGGRRVREGMGLPATKRFYLKEIDADE